MIKSYNRSAAVRYAVRWALGRNPRYYDYAEIGGDCTNFASQCLYAGSGVMDYTETFGWYYIDANQKSPSWTGVEYLYNYLTREDDRPGPFASVVSRQLIRRGDLIQISFDGDTFTHTLVVLTTAPQILIAAHSEDSLFRPLYTYNYKAIRYLHIEGVKYDAFDRD